MFNIKSPMVWVVIALIIISGFWWYLKAGQPRPTTTPTEQTTEPAPLPATPTSTTQPTKPPAPKPTPTPSTVKPAAKNSIVSPKASDRWIVGENHVIQWSLESGVKGGIYLVRASDKSIVGWINSETGPHQTSYTWDTRYLFVDRYSNLKKNLEKGEYILVIKFDRVQQPEISSGVFSTVYASEVSAGVHNFEIKNYVFSPSSMTVKKGDKLVFKNSDPVTHRVMLSSFSPFAINAGDSFTFDTSVLFPGLYNFYSEAYQSLKLAVTVQ